MDVFNGLEAELRAIEKKKETLLSLLHNGEISQSIFDLLEKRVSRVASAIIFLKGTLDEEETFWRSNNSEETRILESLLIDFKLHHLLGEIGEEEYKQKSKIITSGLESLNGKETLIEEITKPALPIQPLSEINLYESIETLLEPEDKKLSEMQSENEKIEKPRKTHRNKYNENKSKKRAAKDSPVPNNSMSPETHCMNPWKPKCKNTNIELSIYYKGQFTPICRECWEDISKNNVEWSGE